jgi:hypothetical protein
VTRLAPEDTMRVRKLVRSGKTSKEIAEELGVEHSCLYRFMRKYGIVGFERTIGTGEYHGT